MAKGSEERATIGRRKVPWTINYGDTVRVRDMNTDAIVLEFIHRGDRAREHFDVPDWCTVEVDRAS